MKAFGFDYDGTIINIEPQKAKAFGQLVSSEWGINSQMASDCWIERGGTSRKFKFDYFYQQKFKRKIPEKIYKEIEAKFSKLLKDKYYPETSLLNGALEILKFAKKNFDLTFISSGVPMEEINFLAKLNAVDKYFDLIMGTSNKFPDKSFHFQTITSKYHPKTLIYLADGLEDMKIAKKFGSVLIGLSTNHSLNKLKQSGANFVCNDLKEALDLCRKISY